MVPQAAQADILTHGDWLTAEQLNALQRDPPARKSEPAGEWKRRGQIFGVSREGREYFPGYQFDESCQPLPVIREILQAFGEAADPWQIAAWFHYPNGWIGKPGSAGQEPMAPREAIGQPEVLLHAAARRHQSYVA